MDHRMANGTTVRTFTLHGRRCWVQWQLAEATYQEEGDPTLRQWKVIFGNVKTRRIPPQDQTCLQYQAFNAFDVENDYNEYLVREGRSRASAVSLVFNLEPLLTLSGSSDIYKKYGDNMEALRPVWGGETPVPPVSCIETPPRTVVPGRLPELSILRTLRDCAAELLETQAKVTEQMVAVETAKAQLDTHTRAVAVLYQQYLTARAQLAEKDGLFKEQSSRLTHMEERLCKLRENMTTAGGQWASLTKV